ncbi:ATP-binding protein [Streptomyces sp. GC420]|uniref:ATP-binding protein n=1 Tax=Streptomyces sp. GC420 TaxID=2697568 RepID=UPI0014152D26|nr:ATP-binding protein [Streptomyces sp. GC420]NBM19123.1 ATP-binding protein [Streptomyces sp. GC420]
MNQPEVSRARPGRRAEVVCRPRLAAEARDVAAAFLSGLEPVPPAVTRQSVLLLVSELVTNALRHAGAITRLRLTAEGNRLRVQVDDPAPARPWGRTPDLSGSTGGFGWHIASRLADGITVWDRADGGKAVAATMPL